jgi:hypothetical protein
MVSNLEMASSANEDARSDPPVTSIVNTIHRNCLRNDRWGLAMAAYRRKIT